MSYTVFMLDEAERDLLSIHSYIEKRFSQALANAIYLEIRDAILMLEEHPRLGASVPQLAALGMNDFRHLVMKKSRVVYELDTKNTRIYVHLICRERQDYETVLTHRILQS